MIGARTEKGVLVILCHGGQNPREKQLHRGKVYLDLWFQRVSVHQTRYQDGVADQEAEAQQGGRQAEPWKAPALLPTSFKTNSIVMGEEPEWF